MQEEEDRRRPVSRFDEMNTHAIHRLPAEPYASLSCLIHARLALHFGFALIRWGRDRAGGPSFAGEHKGSTGPHHGPSCCKPVTHHVPPE